MALYWLCYPHNNSISVVIEPGPSLIHARMRAALAGLDEAEFTEGQKWADFRFQQTGNRSNVCGRHIARRSTNISGMVLRAIPREAEPRSRYNDTSAGLSNASE